MSGVPRTVHSLRISCGYSSRWRADERRSRVLSWEGVCAGARRVLCIAAVGVPQQNDVLCAGCFSLSTEANGLGVAGLAAPFVARSSSLEIGAGLLQATLAAALHISPPLIPLRLRQVARDHFLCVAVMDESSCRPRQVDGDGAAKRRRLRRLRSWWRHEQQTVAAVLATYQHHSAPRGPRTARTGGRARDELHGYAPEDASPQGSRPPCLGVPRGATCTGTAAHRAAGCRHSPSGPSSRRSCAAGGRHSAGVLPCSGPAGCRAGHHSAQDLH